MSSSQIRQSTSPIKPRHAHARYSSVTYRDAEPNLQAARPCWQCKPRRNGELVSGTPFPDGQKKDSLDASPRRNDPSPLIVAITFYPRWSRWEGMQKCSIIFPITAAARKILSKARRQSSVSSVKRGIAREATCSRRVCARVVRKCVQGCGERGRRGSSDVRGLRSYACPPPSFLRSGHCYTFEAAGKVVGLARGKKNGDEKENEKQRRTTTTHFKVLKF